MPGVYRQETTGNPLTFLDPEGQLTLLPLFVNCCGEEAREYYPPRPTAKRCYELGQSIRRAIASYFLVLGIKHATEMTSRASFR